MGNTPSAVPYGAQITNISTTLACSVLGSYGDYNLSISATAPLIGSSGQPIYYSDVVIDLDLFGVFQASFGEDFPGNYSITANIGLDLNNVQGPTTYNITANTTADNRQSHVRFPYDGGVLPPIGPITLGATTQIHSFSLGKVDFVVNVTTAGIVLNVDCIKQDPHVIIGSTAIDQGQSTTPLAPANGVPGTFPHIKPGQKTTIAHYPVSCKSLYQGFFIEQSPFNLTLGGVIPNVLKGGQQFNITDITSFLTVPGLSVVGFGAFYQGDPKEVYFELAKNGTPGFGLQVLGASPPMVDLSTDFRSTNNDIKPLQGNRLFTGDPDMDLSVGLPPFGSLVLGPFTAESGQVGTNFEIVQGKFDIHGYNADGGFTDGMTFFNCTPAYSTQIWTALIGG